jgi:hypothetical protein
MQNQTGRLSALNSVRFITIALLITALCFVGACTTTSPPPPGTASSDAAIKKGVPGGVFVNTVEVSVKVTAIDTAKRKLTLLLPDGEKTTVKAGPEVVNFDQIRSGDLITATLTEETVVYLDAEGASAPDGAAVMVALAPKGSKPGGIVAETTQVTATVAAIDPAKRTATLRFADGSTQTFPVRDDIDLSQRKTGEKVVIVVTEMIALSVEKP